MMYILFTDLTVTGTILIYKFLVTKVHTIARLWMVRSLIVISMVLILFGGSELQMNFIEDYEIPPVLGCVYYDKYDNLIYNSQYRGTCPILENVVYSTVVSELDSDYVIERLSFEVDEDTFNEINNSEYTNKSSTIIEIIYEPIEQEETSKINEKLIQRISIDLIEFVNKTDLKTDTTKHTRNRYFKIVENDFGEMLDDDVVTESMTRSTITEYSDSQSYTIESDVISGLDSTDVTSLEPTITIQEATYTEITDEGYTMSNDNLLNHYFSINMTEQITKDTLESDVYLFAEGNRRNTLNSLTLIDYASPFGKTMGYNARYGESQWWSFSERYDMINYDVYPSKDIEIGYSYYNNVFEGHELRNLEMYTKTDIEYETTEEMTIEKYEREESTFLVDENKSIEAIDTDYGRKLMYYSTRRSSNGSYTTLPDSESVLMVSTLVCSDFMPLTMFYNSKEILFDVSTYKPFYMIPQKNLLFYGVPSMVLVYL